MDSWMTSSMRAVTIAVAVVVEEKKWSPTAIASFPRWLARWLAIAIATCSTVASLRRVAEIVRVVGVVCVASLVATIGFVGLWR